MTESASIVFTGKSSQAPDKTDGLKCVLHDNSNSG